MFQFPRVKLAFTSAEEVSKNHLNERTVSTLNLLLGGTALIHVLMLHQMITKLQWDSNLRSKDKLLIL